MNLTKLNQLYFIALTSIEFKEEIKAELQTIKIKTIEEKLLLKKIKKLID